jgi:hypothetical protein
VRDARFGWWGITIYAVAMGFLETACVITLKRLYFPEGWTPPFHAIPAAALTLEQAREVATLVMIAAVASLGRPSWKEALARGLWIFGVWDLVYYAFLRLLTGFPGTLADLDIVFLVPRQWVAPVWTACAASIAALLLALRLHRADPGPPVPMAVIG